MATVLAPRQGIGQTNAGLSYQSLYACAVLQRDKPRQQIVMVLKIFICFCFNRLNTIYYRRKEPPLSSEKDEKDLTSFTKRREV